MFLSAFVRDVTGGLDSSSLSPQYRKGSRPVPAASAAAAVPDCSDCHELETLMPSSAQEPSRPLTEPSEEHSLMGNVGAADDGLAEPKVSTFDNMGKYC